eukprot:365706-Chlamydomonas_euryale.AAC.10
MRRVGGCNALGSVHGGCGGCGCGRQVLAGVVAPPPVCAPLSPSPFASPPLRLRPPPRRRSLTLGGHGGDATRGGAAGAERQHERVERDACHGGAREAGVKLNTRRAGPGGGSHARRAGASRQPHVGPGECCGHGHLEQRQRSRYRAGAGDSKTPCMLWRDSSSAPKGTSAHPVHTTAFTPADMLPNNATLARPRRGLPLYPFGKLHRWPRTRRSRPPT